VKEEIRIESKKEKKEGRKIQTNSLYKDINKERA
jgi:hypothetical protein